MLPLINIRLEKLQRNKITLCLTDVNHKSYTVTIRNLPEDNERKMKTILVLTSYSKKAEHAAEYALHIAERVKANLLLCNIFTAPEKLLPGKESPALAKNTSLLEDVSKKEMLKLLFILIIKLI